MPEPRRRAMIIGINDYTDNSIPALKGCEGDCAEIHDKLTESGYEILPKHYLRGTEATSGAIREAVSDLFWEADPCDVVLFYFSGHGIVDGYGRGYLAPRDMKMDKPFVNGIPMREIRDIVIGSPGKSTVLMILDCCHSGIAIKDAKGGDEDVGQAFGAQLKSLSAGNGRCILASSRAEQKSKEKEFTVNGRTRHYGEFSYHLIQGLGGEASDDSGVITLGRLNEYLEGKFSGAAQKPIVEFSGSDISKIQIAVASSKHEQFILEKLEEAERLFNDRDLSCLISCVEIILKITPEVRLSNREVLAFIAKVDAALPIHKQNIGDWISDNQTDVRPRLMPLFQNVILKIDSHINFEGISKLDKTHKNILLLLFNVQSGELSVPQFIEKCQRYNQPSAAQSPSSSLTTQARGVLS
ncbi:MAG: caspase family protein [Deltaproteobacteria bacterium]